MKYYFKCPRCKNDEEFLQPKEEMGNLGCSLLLLGGMIPYLLAAEHNSRRVLCLRCGYIFQQPGLPWCQIALITFLGLTLAGTACVIAVLYYAVNGAGDSLPSFALLAPLEKAIAEAPHIALYLLFLLAFLGIAFGWLLIAVSNGAHREALSKRYRLQPPLTRHGYADKAPEPGPSDKA